MESWILAVFGIGYAAIIFEYTIRVNKTAVALLLAVCCWAVYFIGSTNVVAENLVKLSNHLSDVSQIIFFLLGAMTLVELIDTHQGFRILTDLIQTSSKRKMLWLIALVSFFLSSVLDNLTTTILMISLLRKIVPERSERLLLSCMVVVAANAGGAWTPIGDVTTTMLWINGQISSWPTIKTLFVPSFISLLLPLLWFTIRQKGCYVESNGSAHSPREPGALVVLILGVGALIGVPVFKAATGLPPFMGVLLGLGLLWLYTDLLHHGDEKRQHLRVPAILTKIDTAGVLFFLGILLAVNALESVGLLEKLAEILQERVKNYTAIATLIGLLSAIIDNVPLVAATMGMYPLSQFPMDDTLWQMIAYAAGTGGSLLVIGSSSGVALMGLERVDFLTYMKKMTLPVLLGYLGGMAAYILTRIL